MKILAIDTSTSIFSLCLKIDDHEEIIEYEAGVTHSKIILQEIKSILKKCGLAVSDLDAIAFSSGPGSFTGIRIASGVAYGLALKNEYRRKFKKKSNYYPQSTIPRWKLCCL